MTVRHVARSGLSRAKFEQRFGARGKKGLGAEGSANGRASAWPRSSASRALLPFWLSALLPFSPKPRTRTSCYARTPTEGRVQIALMKGNDMPSATGSSISESSVSPYGPSSRFTDASS